MTNHGYTGSPPDESGQYRSLCKCGWKSPPFVQRRTAMLKLLDHRAAAEARDAKAASRARSKSAKRAARARKRVAA